MPVKPEATASQSGNTTRPNASPAYSRGVPRSRTRRKITVTTPRRICATRLEPCMCSSSVSPTQTVQEQASQLADVL